MTNGDSETKSGISISVSGVDCHDSYGHEPAGIVSGQIIPFRAVNNRLLLSCVTFAASAMAFGYDDKLISPIAALETFVVRYQGFNKSAEKQVFTAYNQDLLFSVPLLGAIFGAATAPKLNDRFGRKKPLVLAYLLSLGATFLQLFAPNLEAFALGRLANAISMGIATTTAPLYLSEVVPYVWRGRAVTSSNVLNLLSGLVATIIVNATQMRTDKLSYMIPLAVQCCAPAILIPMTMIVPESPQWLVSKDRISEARAHLRLLRAFPETLVEEELRVIVACENNERELSAGVKLRQLFSGRNLVRTITAGSVFSFNQISGIILSTTYATIFLTELGVAKPFTLTIIASSCVLAGTLVAPLFIDRLGRRSLALSGMGVLLIIDIVAGALAFKSKNSEIALVIAILSFLFNFVWAVSFYSLSILLPTEIATPKLRNMTMSYAIICAYSTAVITTFAVPQIVSSDAGDLGAKAYLVFAGCMVLIIIFFYTLLPETSRRSFAEIDEMYALKIPMRRWSKYRTVTTAKMNSI